MVSRRKILSRSRDNLVESQYEEQDEEDVWYNLDKLYKVNLYLLLVNFIYVYVYYYLDVCVDYVYFIYIYFFVHKMFAYMTLARLE